MKRGVPCERDDPNCPEATGTGIESLSDTFVQEAANRFGLIGLTIAGTCLVAILAGFLMHDLLELETHEPQLPGRIRRLVLVLLSLGMFGLSRTTICPRKLLNIGLGYQVVGGLLISTTIFWGAQLEHGTLSLGWLGVWIVLFPLIVPARPLKNIVCSLATASTAPAVYFAFMASSGSPLPDWHTVVMAFLPYYVCTGLAIVPATAMYRMGKSVTQAERELKALGSYQLVELLGEGAMGEVWRAEHRMLARPAAIKLIKKSMLSEGADSDPDTVIARFEREAQATAALSSPHTISLYDFGVTDEGVFYYVMEHLRGVDLDSVISRHGPMCPSRTIDLLVQACHSLAEAHAVGLIHRDVKPANIFLCKLGLTHDFVKLLDFGLVRRDRRAQGGDSLKLTGNEAIVGTPAFMAPEQVQGGEIDARVDIYALGCVGYWLLTGRYVFEANSAMSMLIDHVKTKPEPASKRIGKRIPPDLDQILLDCLQKDPLLRPPTAEALAERLLACDVPTWSQLAARKWWGEHLTDLAGGGGIVDPRAMTTLEGAPVPVI